VQGRYTNKTIILIAIVLCLYSEPYLHVYRDYIHLQCSFLSKSIFSVLYLIKERQPHRELRSLFMSGTQSSLTKMKHQLQGNLTEFYDPRIHCLRYLNYCGVVTFLNCLVCHWVTMKHSEKLAI
jgi:hypothetical protein